MKYPTLTHTEKLILRGATYGMKSNEIAQSLGLSQEVVGREIADIYTKVQVIERERLFRAVPLPINNQSLSPLTFSPSVSKSR